MLAIPCRVLLPPALKRRCLRSHRIPPPLGPSIAVPIGGTQHRAKLQISSGDTKQRFGFRTQQMLECAIQVAKADKLNSSYLAQGT